MAVRSTAKTPEAPSPGAPAGASGPAPSLVPHGAHAGKPALPLHRPLILVGSRQRAHVHLISNSVSRVHAVIINTDHGSYVRDLASRTGTIVNGRQVKEAGLRHSDSIQVGAFQFKFADATGRGPLAAARRAPAAVLHIQGQSAPFALEGRTALIGQRDTCDVTLRSTAVSTAHAIVFELNGRHFVRDLGSRTGTFVNGRQIHQEALEVGDMVRIGETAIRYASAAPAEAVDVSEEEDQWPATQEDQATSIQSPAREPAEGLAPLPVPIPVTAVVPTEEPAEEQFHDLTFAADGLGTAAVDEPIAGEEPLPVGEVTATLDDSAVAPPAVTQVPIEPLESETEWRPALPSVASAETAATTHTGFEADPVPLAGDELPPPLPTDTLPPPPAQTGPGDQATAEEMFGSDAAFASDIGAGFGATPPPLPVEERTIPLDDPEPAVAEAQQLAPLPAMDDAGFDAGEGISDTARPMVPPLLPELTDREALNPDIDFPAETDSVADALNEPFGPLTDLSLDLHDDAGDPPPVEARRSVLDEIDLMPVAPAYVEERGTVHEEPMKLTPVEPEPVQIEPAPSEPVQLEPLSLESSALESIQIEPVQAETESIEAVEQWGVPSESEAPMTPADALGDAVSLSAMDFGTDAGTITDSEAAEVTSDAPAASASIRETVATFDPVVPGMPDAADVGPHATHLEPVATEPEFVPADSDRVDVTSIQAEPSLEVEAPVEPQAPPAETSATIPPDLDIGSAPAAVPEPEMIAPVAPEDVVATAPADIVPPAPTKKRGGRKPAAKKPVPEAAPPAAEPKKKRPWGKKAKEAVAAEQAAAAAASAAAAAAAAAAAVTAASSEAASATTAPALSAAAAARAAYLASTEAPALPLVPPSASADAPDHQPPASIADVVTDAEPGPEALPEPEAATAFPPAPESPQPPGSPAATVETLAPTEPSPESALDLRLADAETIITGAGLADDVSMTSSEVAAEIPPSDLAFDAMIEEFVGSSTGPIVEQREEPATTPTMQDPLPMGATSYDAPPTLPSFEDESPAELSATMPADLMEADAPPADVPANAPPEALLADAAAADELGELAAQRDEGWDNAGPAAATPQDAAAGKVSAPPPQEPPQPPPRARPFDPFLGMGRDLGSFIGGLPLNLSSPDPLAGDLPEPFSLGVPPPPPTLPPPSFDPVEFPVSPPRGAKPQQPSFEPPAPDDLDRLDEFEPPLLTDLEPTPPFGQPGRSSEMSLEPPPLEELLPPSGPTARDLDFDPLALEADAPRGLADVAMDGGTLDAAALDGADLDLPLPDLTVPDAPRPGSASATAPDGLLDPSALDLPELTGPGFEPPPVTPPPGGRDEDEVDPLLFTEAESPTLHLLPKPQAPQPPQAPGNRAGPKDRGGSATGNRPPIKPPASKYPATPPPPARSGMPRRAPPRMPFDVDSAGLGPALGIPAGGARPAPAAGGAAAHAFDGLALPPVREADVFSGLPLGADDPMLSGSNLGGARKPGQRVRRAEGGRRPGHGQSATPEELAPLAPLPPLPPVARRGRPAPGHDAAAPSAAVPGATPRHAPTVAPHGPATHGAAPGWNDPMGAPPPRRRVGLGVYLVLMIASLVAATAGILFLGPRPSVEVVGTLQFERLRDLGPMERDQFTAEQREWLGKPEFRDQARELLLVSYLGVSPGFLGTDDQAIAAYDQIVKGAHVKERTGGLTLPYRGNDESADRARMDALVKALHNKNLPRGDSARLKQSQYDKAQKDLAALAEKLAGVNQRARELRAKAESVPDLEKELLAAKGEHERLRSAATAARRDADRLRAEIGRAQGAAAPGATPGMTPAALVSLASLLLIDEPVIDPAVAATTAPTTAPADDDATLAAWRDELARVEAELAAPPRMPAPVERPRRAAPRAEERATAPTPRGESRRRQAGANDPVLRRMEEELGYKVRHRNAALGGGLAKEAAKLDDEIAVLSARLAVARELVGAGLPDEQTGELQKLIDERVGRAGRADEAAHAARADATPADPSAARKAREASERRAAELRTKIAAREAELTAARDLASRQAAAERELAAIQDAAQPAAAQDRAAQDAAPAAAETGADRQKLEAALAAALEREGEAAAAANGVAENVRRIESAIADARKAETDLAQVMRDLSTLEPAHARLLKTVEELRKEQATAVVPMDPGADAVAVSAVGQDHRYLWMLIADGAIVVLFSFLMWQSAHGGQAMAIPDRENPFEAPVIGAPLPPADTNPDDERPLAV